VRQFYLSKLDAGVRVFLRWSTRYLLLHPLVVLLPVQAALLFWNVGLLTIWTDELVTLEAVTQPVVAILRSTGADFHPPLYFLAAHAWIQLPLPGGVMERIRALSCVSTLIATLLFDRLWLARLRPWRRVTVLLLWCLSPTMLLYGRMGRSYMMQTALVILAVAVTGHALRRPGRRNMTWSAVALLAVLYTHYAPGIALIVATGIVFGIRAIRLRSSAQMGLLAGWSALVMIGYLPWWLHLRDALPRWIAGTNPSAAYWLTGHFLTEQPLKAGFGFVSLSLGETFPVWALAAVPLIAIGLVGSFRRLQRANRGLAYVLLLAAIIGYAATARWVSYPFVPARMIWLLPFFVLSVALCPGFRPSLRVGLVAFVLVADLVSIVSYFRRESFRNRGYAMPLADIAATVRSQSDPAATLLMLDKYNTDAQVIQYYLADNRIPRVLPTPETKPEIARRLRDPGLRHFWSLRNTHDISPARLNLELEDLACGQAPRRIRFYGPYAEWERATMRVLGIAEPPTHFYQLMECFPAPTPMR
jgi:hypothetical protein